MQPKNTRMDATNTQPEKKHTNSLDFFMPQIYEKVLKNHFFSSFLGGFRNFCTFAASVRLYREVLLSDESSGASSILTPPSGGFFIYHLENNFLFVRVWGCLWRCRSRGSGVWCRGCSRGKVFRSMPGLNRKMPRVSFPVASAPRCMASSRGVSGYFSLSTCTTLQRQFQPFGRK